MALNPVIPLEQTFDGLYGLKILETSADLMTAEVEVSDRIKQPMGLVHGGLYATIAESLASIGTFLGVHEDNKIAVGLSNSTNFIRPIVEGKVLAQAKPRHRGKTTWVWDIDLTDQQQRLCATSRVTIAVRDRPAT